jgi:hypothetical protein
MKILLAAGLLIVATAFPDLPLAQTAQGPTTGTWRARMSDSWTRGTGERWVSLDLRRDDERRFGMSIRMSELEAAGVRGDRWSGGDIRFALTRDAGTLDFDGAFDSGRGAGTFRFTPNASFVAAVQQSTSQLTVDDVLKLAIHDVSRSFMSSIEAQGYKGLSLDDFVKLRIHGVDADYIVAMRKAGYDKLSVDELLQSRIHGATPTYVVELRNAGYSGLSIEALVRTRIHGAGPAFIQELESAGLEKLDIDDLVQMRIHGVTAAFIKELSALGFKNVAVEDLVKLRIHGVDADFIRDVQKAGIKDVTPRDLVDLSIHGGRRWLQRMR